MRLVTSLIALAMAIGAVVLPGAADAAEVPEGSVTFAPAGFGALAPGQDLVLNGTISNPTTKAIPAGTARVVLNRTPVSSRADLAAWLNTDSAIADDKVGTSVLETSTPEVAAGRSAPVVITVPAASVTFGSQASIWGARRIAVTVRSGNSVVGQARTDVVWSPGSPVAATGLAVAVPLTVPHSPTGLVSADLLATYTDVGGLLTRELDAIIGRNVAIGIDPMILASIRILGDSAPPSALLWLARLQGARNDTFALSYADSDLAGANQAGARRLLAPTTFPIDATLFPGASTATPSPQTGTPTPAPTPTPTGQPVNPLPTPESLVAWPYTIDKVAWPADDTVMEADLDAFGSFGLTSTIMSSSNVSYNLDYTPSAATTIDKHRVLVSDNTISTLLRSAASATSQLAWENAMVKLSGAIAVVGRERPSESRTLLATLGRDVTGSDFRLSQTLDALAALPWVTPSTVSKVAAASDPVTAAVSAKPEAAAHVATIKSLLDSEARVGNFSSVLANPTVLTTERRLSLLALLSNTWSTDDTGWAAATAKYDDKSRAILDSVSIAESSSLLLTSHNSPLPVTVNNALAWPVTVYVSVRSPTGILNVLEPRVELTIEANSQAKASVPVRSVANGDVLVQTTLSSATNVPIGSAVQTKVAVQAGWETAFTAVVAVLVVGVFGFGIWRNVNKRRKAKKLARGTEPVDGPSDAPTPAEPPSESSPS